MKNINAKYLLWILGLLFAAIYIILLIWKPQESWCDDAFWADWGRQMGINGSFTTNVWGAGKPSYSPGYALILACVFRVFGFSYISAQLPNILLTFCAFVVLGLALINQNAGRFVIILYSILFWCLNRMYITLGRPEILSMLLAIIVVIAFIQKRRVLLLIASFLLMSTSVQGVIAATLFVVIYLCCDYKEFRSKRQLLYVHMGGYIGGLAATSILMYRYHCLKAFFDTMFGFSKTFTSFYVQLRMFIKTRVMGKVIDDVAITSTGTNPIENLSHNYFFRDVLSGYVRSTEFIIAILLLLALIICYYVKHKTVAKDVLTATIMAVIVPLVYRIAGRYVSYYGWVALIPCIYAICSLIKGFDVKRQYKVIIVGVATLVIVLNCVRKGNIKLDFQRLKDKANLEEIAFANIDASEPVIIPYSWYYYIIESDENVYFQWSGAYPESITRVIIDPSDMSNNPSLMNSCEFSHSLITKEEWIKIY